ncbi:hypothetical protein Pfo_026368, partial [Paulownia fortunei]
GCYKMRHLNVLLVLILSILLCVQLGKGSRLLHDQVETLKEKGLSINSLQKGPVPPSGPSGCTNIPGSGGGGCPINEMHFAGRGAPPHGGGSAAYPHSVVSFGVATKQK